MSPRPKLAVLLSLVSCLLTLAASGDDVCFVRLIFVPETLGSVECPLDDPNTDFLELRESSNRQLPGWDADGGMTNAPADTNAVRVACAGTRRPLLIDGNFCIAPLNTPLLC